MFEIWNAPYASGIKKKRVYIQDRPMTETNTYMYQSGRQNDVT